MNIELRELSEDELELAAGGTIILEDAAPTPYPPGPSAMFPPGPSVMYPPGPTIIAV